MVKYTGTILECEKCFKKNSFLVHIIKKDDKAYYLTQCPRCKSYEEVKEISLDEYNKLKPNLLTHSE